MCSSGRTRTCSELTVGSIGERSRSRRPDGRQPSAHMVRGGHMFFGSRLTESEENLKNV